MRSSFNYYIIIKTYEYGWMDTYPLQMRLKFHFLKTRDNGDDDVYDDIYVHGCNADEFPCILPWSHDDDLSCTFHACGDGF